MNTQRLLHDAQLDDTNRRIIELVASGLSNQEIAEELHLSCQTVRNRITRIFDATGARNRTELAVMWLKAAA